MIIWNAGLFNSRRSFGGFTINLLKPVQTYSTHSSGGYRMTSNFPVERWPLTVTTT